MERETLSAEVMGRKDRATGPFASGRLPLASESGPGSGRRAPAGAAGPQGPVARPDELGRAVSGLLELVLELRQVPVGNAAVDVVGEVPAGLEGHEPELGPERLVHVVGS